MLNSIKKSVTDIYIQETNKKKGRAFYLKATFKIKGS